MKKLMFVLGSLLVASTSMAEGTAEICGEKVDRVTTHNLDSISSESLDSTVRVALASGTNVKICAVGALPVAIVVEKDRSGKIVRHAKVYVPEMD